MRCSDLRVRLLAVVSATTLAATAVAACGSDSTPDTGAQSDSGGAANGDARGDAFASGDGAGGDGTTDSSVADTSATDSGGDERPPSIRRPFLVGSSLRSARSQARDDWSAARLREDEAFTLDAGIGGELAKAWLTDGLEEHASIAAFARFTMMLLSVAAPPELVAASQRASLDEITHARDCFALARRYGARDAGPGALDVHDSLGPMSLADLAALTAEEGCVGETLGAALAGEQLAVAVDPRCGASWRASSATRRAMPSSHGGSSPGRSARNSAVRSARPASPPPSPRLRRMRSPRRAPWRYARP